MLENLVKLVGRMSFGERLDTDLADSDTDKKNLNVMTRCQSMMINEDQYREN